MMTRPVLKLKMPTKDWVWGPSANWKIYSSAKKKLGSSDSAVVNGSVLRYISKIAGGYQENVVDACKSVVVKARKVIRPRFYSIHSHGGAFGPIINSILANNKKRKGHMRNRRHFMSDERQLLLTNDEINTILRRNEHTAFFNSSLAARIDFNELSSNRPMEDQTFACRSCHDDGIIVGILDGHGGSTFAERVKKYLPLYVSASLVDSHINSVLDDHFNTGCLVESVMKSSHPGMDKFLTENLIDYIKEVSKKSPAQNDPGTFSTYVRQLLGPSVLVGSESEEENSRDVSDSLKESFVRLDLDMVNEIINLSKFGKLESKDLGITASGCCALVAHINGNDLHIANSGDCRAVMGSLHDGQWSSIQLTLDHTTTANPEEVQRILSEHPKEESRSCIQYGRLLGRLAPLRAFGDIRFKMDADQQKALIGSLDPKFKSFPTLKTPPYLTAEPEVFQYKLEKSDKFIVMASDGLWDMLSNQEVVELVGSYMDNRAADAMKNRAVNASIANLDDVLSVQGESDVEKDNVATFLIRCALGGYDHHTLSAMLTLPYPDVRMYRDDISVAVIFFDHDAAKM